MNEPCNAQCAHLRDYIFIGLFYLINTHLPYLGELVVAMGINLLGLRSEISINSAALNPLFKLRLSSQEYLVVGLCAECPWCDPINLPHYK